VENLCGRRRPEPQKDSPNPWFGGKNRVKRRLMALRHFRKLAMAGEGPKKKRSE
jgi:hypothetical protein